jgi:L-ascorbate metabolism protein UlaG (beta-lactamase superfamily)
MEITYLGHASFRIKGKGVSLVTDPFSPEDTGLKFPKVEAQIVTISHQHQDHNQASLVGGQPQVFEGPGEYEASGVKILGIATSHDNLKGLKRGKNTVFQIKIDNLTLVHLGDLGHKLETKDIEALNGVDILFVPVGGVFTVDAKGAAEVVAQLEPRIVIPMHYQSAKLTFDLEPVEKFLKEMGKEEIRAQEKLAITKDKLPEEMEVVLLE